tara:strand:+ start:99 stop:365 length:267 start_codon:yes stop_codon:yes gene_type:complete
MSEPKNEGTFPLELVTALEAIIENEPEQSARIFAVAALMMNQMQQINREGLEINLGPYVLTVKAELSPEVSPEELKQMIAEAAAQKKH